MRTTVKSPARAKRADSTRTPAAKAHAIELRNRRKAIALAGAR